MVNRIVPAVLIVVLGALHAQMWLGRGSVPQVKQLRAKISEQQAANAQSQRVNERLTSEVNDLQEGLDMVEEKARNELGMVRPNEIYVQITK